MERFLPPDAKDDVTNFDVREHGLDGAVRLFSLLHTYRSGLGPLEVAYPVLPSGLEKPFAEATKALGVNPLPDPARDHFFCAYWCR